MITAKAYMTTHVETVRNSPEIQRLDDEHADGAKAYLDGLESILTSPDKDSWERSLRIRGVKPLASTGRSNAYKAGVSIAYQAIKKLL